MLLVSLIGLSVQARDDFSQAMLLTNTVICFFMVLFGGTYMAKSVRTAVAFRDQSALKDHLRYKVFFGGASMMISMLYLCLESGGCVFSMFEQPTIDMLLDCDGIKGPNYSVGMHLACIFIYSVYFGPFNSISIPQLVRLDITVMQRVEGFVFGFASVCALFLFGAKRPHKELPKLYENLMLSIYISWFFIYCIELFHVFNILKDQKKRKLDITAEVAQEVKELKTVVKDIEAHPTHHFSRDRRGSIVQCSGKQSITSLCTPSISTHKSSLARSSTAGAILSGPKHSDSAVSVDTMTSERVYRGKNLNGKRGRTIEGVEEEDDEDDNDFFGKR